MKKILSIFALIICTSLISQIQNFNIPVRFKSVETASVDSVDYIYAPGPDGVMVKVHKDSIGSDQFVEITEGANTGYGTKYRVENEGNYGNIGNNAVDLQISTSSGNNGATGNYSSTIGGTGNTSGGTYSTVIGGTSNSSSGNYSGILAGNNNTTSGVNSAAVGSFLSARAFNEIAVGRYNNFEVPQSTTGWNPADRLFSIGNGNAAGSRSDAFVVRKDGLVTFPSLTDQMITDGPEDVAITRGWFENNIPEPEPLEWENITGDQSSVNLMGFEDGAPLELNFKLTSVSTGSFTDIVYAEGMFVAVGQSGTIATSTDGENWTFQESPITGNHYSRIAYGDGLFIAVGNGKVIKSTDGENWEEASIPAVTDPVWYSVAYGDGKWVILNASVGSGNYFNLLYSEDGENWTAYDTLDPRWWTDVKYGNGRFVATTSGQIWTSLDGINWHRVVNGGGFFDSVEYGNGRFVAVTNNGLSNQIEVSTDGENWTNHSSPTAGLGLSYGDGLFMLVYAMGTNRLSVSPDGENWTSYATPQNNPWRSVAYGDGKWVIGSTDGSNRLINVEVMPAVEFENNVNSFMLNDVYIPIENKILNIEVPTDIADLSDNENLLFSGDYDDLTNTPDIPEQFNPIAGTGISISGTYPNITFNATGGSTGTVTSVNSINPDGSGNVEIDSDDIPEGSTNLYVTTADLELLNSAIQPDDLSEVATTGDYSDLTNKPTTISGYGITDAFTKTESDGRFLRENEDITLSGDVTGIGNTAITATISNDAVTNSKLANVPQFTIKGRVSSGTGDPTDLSVDAVLKLLGFDGKWETTFTDDVTFTTTGSIMLNADLADVPDSTEWDAAKDWEITWKDGGFFYKISSLNDVSEAALSYGSGNLSLTLTVKNPVTIPAGAVLKFE